MTQVIAKLLRIIYEVEVCTQEYNMVTPTGEILQVTDPGDQAAAEVTYFVIDKEQKMIVSRTS